MTTAELPTADARPRLIDGDEFATRLGVSPATFSRLRARGELPEPVKLGRLVRWPEPEVSAWIVTRDGRGRLPDSVTWRRMRATAMRESGQFGPPTK